MKLDQEDKDLPGDPLAETVSVSNSRRVLSGTETDTGNLRRIS
jgi:hypothetical protein